MRAFIEQPDLQATQVTADKALMEADWHGELVGWVREIIQSHHLHSLADNRKQIYMLQYLGLHDLVRYYSDP